MIELIRRLDRQQFAVHVACFHREGPWLPLAEQFADSLTEFPVTSFHSRATARVAADFRRWCRARHLAVLQTSDLYANIFGLPLAALARVPLRIASRRELNPDKTTGQLTAQRVAYSFAHRVVANSTAAIARLRREGIRRRCIVHVPNGIDLERFHPGVASPAPPRRIVTVARLRPEKGHDTLLDAAPAILRAFPDARLTIVGDGPLHDVLAARIAKGGLQDHVALAGHTDDVAETLRAHDVFVLASRSEAFPNAVIEAMAAGLPIVATEVGGIPELIEHGRNGLLVPPGRAADLAGTVNDLLHRPAFARALGRKARADVMARYSFDRMVRSFEDLYLAQLGVRRPLYPLRSHSQPVTS